MYSINRHFYSKQDTFVSLIECQTINTYHSIGYLLAKNLNINKAAILEITITIEQNNNYDIKC